MTRKDSSMTETHEQRVERLARAAYEGATYWCAENDQKDHEEADPYEGQIADFCRALARAIIASDREAGYVTVPREPTQRMHTAMCELGCTDTLCHEALKCLFPERHYHMAELYEAALAAHEQEERQDAP